MIAEIAAGLCVLLCIAGHVFRDGYPSTGHTNLGARPGGAFLCLLGALAAAWGAGTSLWHASAFGFAIYAGFYADSRHGAGQGMDKPIDWLWESISGLTSLLPLGLAAVLIFDASFEVEKMDIAWLALTVPVPMNVNVHWLSPMALIPLAGLVKPPVWWLANYVRPDRWWWFLEPTRVGAIVFGGVVGGLLVVLLT